MIYLFGNRKDFTIVVIIKRADEASLSDLIIADIDRQMAAIKKILGIVQWVAAPAHAPYPSQEFKAILSIDGDTEGLALKGRAGLDHGHPSVQIMLIRLKLVIQRVSFSSRSSHTNGNSPYAPKHLIRMRFPARSHRIYAWENNRTWPSPKSGEIAEPLPDTILTIDLAIAYMLMRSNIEGVVPSPTRQAVLL